MADITFPNLARHYAAQYKQAIDLFCTERHEESVAMLEEMAADPHLTLWFCLQVHDSLAEGKLDADASREHLNKAEAAYAEILERWPVGTKGQEMMHERLPLFRQHFNKLQRELDEIDAEAEAALETEAAGRSGDEENVEMEGDLDNVPPPVLTSTPTPGHPHNGRTSTLKTRSLEKDDTPVASPSKKGRKGARS